MRIGDTPYVRFAKGWIGTLAAAVLAVGAVLPASASAGDLIVPHASKPHEVEVHSVTSTPAPAPPPTVAPAPSPPPAASSGDEAEPEEPGSEVPPGRGGTPRPTGPGYWSPD